MQELGKSVDQSAHLGHICERYPHCCVGVVAGDDVRIHDFDDEVDDQEVELVVDSLNPADHRPAQALEARLLAEFA